MNKVKEIRKERGMSQEVLAQYSEISRKYLSLIERQKASPSISIAIKIGGALGVSIDKIFLDLSATEKPAYPNPIRFVDLFCGIGGFRYASQYAFDKLRLNVFLHLPEDNYNLLPPAKRNYMDTMKYFPFYSHAK